jgi:hypothetical protein
MFGRDEVRDLTQYRCFKVFRNSEGTFFEGGGSRYVVFYQGYLVGAYMDSCSAERRWKKDPLTAIRLSDYAGIDERVRN